MKKKEINLQDIANYEINPIKQNNNIFVIMTKELIHKELKDWKETKWYNYFKTYKPKSLGDIYNINSPVLKTLPPETIFEPWTHDKPVPLNSFKRLGIYGPKEDKYIYSQIEKTKNLIDSIKKHNYIESNNIKNNLVIEILRYNNKEKYLISGGNHRINVLKALSYKKVNVFLKDNIHIKTKNIINNKRYNKNEKYEAVIDYENAINWPGVKSKFLSLEEAQKMFLAYFK